jgi:flagellar protein FlbT
MSGLLLKLAPNERILINGLMFENGPKKTKITLHSEGAHVLRLRDAIHPNEVVGPISIAYHFAQLAVAGEGGDAEKELKPRLRDLSGVFDATWAADAVSEAKDALATGNFYKVMRSLKQLLPLEPELLGAKAQ